MLVSTVPKGHKFKAHKSPSRPRLTILLCTSRKRDERGQADTIRAFSTNDHVGPRGEQLFFRWFFFLPRRKETHRRNCIPPSSQLASLAALVTAADPAEQKELASASFVPFDE